MCKLFKNFLEKNDKKDFDKAAEDLRLATRHLGMIVGKVDVEEILGSIFNDFVLENNNHFAVFLDLFLLFSLIIKAYLSNKTQIL